MRREPIRTAWQCTRAAFASSRVSACGLWIITGIVLVALLASVLTGYDPNSIDMTQRLQPPSAAHWMGTDEVGRDLFSRVVHGARVSLAVGFGVVFIGALCGLLVGCFSGLAGGRTDAAIMRLIDVVMGLPGPVIALGLAAALGPSLVNAMLAVAVLGIPAYARVARAQTLSVRSQQFIHAARAMGASRWHLLRRHVLPNVMAPMIVLATLDVGGAIIGTATLSFIGLGAQPPLAEWGAMVNAGQAYILDQWWYVFFPGVAIVITAMGFNLLGDGIRDVLDPKAVRS
jgi:peptide/nickel transport system permease protein